jgi:hypothetical protein
MQLRSTPFIIASCFLIAVVNAQVPTIASFSPVNGPIGTTVNIAGTNFSSTPANNIVYFGATTAAVSASTTTQLTVTVPTGATFQPITVNVGGLTAYSAKPFIVTFSGASSINVNGFSAKTDFASGTRPYELAFGDIDGDGKPDLVAANLASSSLSVFRNTGSSGTLSASSFAPRVDLGVYSGPVTVVLSDLDGDGKLDLINSNSTNVVSIYRNLSSAGTITGSSFEARVDLILAPHSVQSLAVRDLDFDGRPEIVVTLGSPYNSVSVIKNLSTPGSITTGSFATAVDFATGIGPGSVSIGDIDGDNKPDIVVANEGAGSGLGVSVLQNLATTGVIDASSFGAKVDFITGTLPRAVEFGDLDGDGKPDLVVSNTNSNNLSVLKNNATAGTINSSTFDAKVDFNTNIFPAGVAIGDINGDGKLDVLVANAGVIAGTSTVSAYRNQSTPGVIDANTLSLKTDLIIGTGSTSQPMYVALGDVDGDGKTDLMISDDIKNTVSVFRNTMTPAPTIVGFNPNVGIAGTSVTITGTNFSATPAANTVKFNGTTAVVTASTITSITATVPAGATTGTITVTQGGLTGTSASSFTVDTSAPAVSSNSTPITVAPASTLNVSANFTDTESGIATASLQYRPIVGTLPNNFITIAMANSSGSTWGATIPSSAVTELGVEYKFLLVNGAGLDNSASQTLYKSAIQFLSGLAISSYPGSAAGTTTSSYRMISVPLVLNDKTVNGVFSDVLGGYDPTAYRLFKYNGSTFNELNGSSTLLPGEGYWFICVSSSPLSTGNGTTVDVDTQNPFKITLNPGWNQIGNPYNFNISWADIIAANPAQAANLGGNNSKFRIFRGAVDNSDVLKATEGGFVKFLGSSAAQIKIPVTKNSSIQGRIASSAAVGSSLDESAWEIMFNLKNGGTEYSLGGIGMDPEAKEGFDYHDDFNSPRFVDYLEVKFPKKYVGMTYTKDVVPTAENYSWSFKVEANLQDPQTTISWDNSYFNTSKSVYLLDVTTHRVTDMNAESGYTFSHSGVNEFKVVIGQQDFVKKELIPDHLVLQDPYPNPFAERSTITYALPSIVKDSGAMIRVYNAQGACVSAMAVQDPGQGSWSWDAGEQASGIYLVRLSVGDQSITRKLIKQ